MAVGFKLGLTHLTPLGLLLLGSIVSWAIFFITCLWRRNFVLLPKDRVLAPVLGALNPCCYYLILFAAYDVLPAHIAQPLNYTWGITLALLAVPVLKQSLTRQALVGILISYLGVVTLVGFGPAHADNISQFGVALALLSTVLWASYWLLNTKSQSDPTSLMFWSFSAALPMLGTAVWITDDVPQLNLTTAFYGLWVGAIEMGITFLLYQRALRITSSVAKISQLIFFSPFISLILIYYFLGEEIGPQTVVGLMMIVAGVILTNRASKHS